MLGILIPRLFVISPRSRILIINRMMSGNKCEIKWPKFILFGASICQQSFSVDGCWGSLIADHLQRKCDVLNRGFSGYNSRWGKIILPQVVPGAMGKDVSGITLLLGANDSNDFALNPKQHVPLEEFKTNMIQMIEYLQSIGVGREKIIVISPPMYDHDAWSRECAKKGRTVSKSLESTKKYATACNDIATEAGVTFVDLYSAMQQQQNWKQLLNDGLHLSTPGSQLLFELLKPKIDQLTSNIEFKFPYWADVDYENTQSSLVPELFENN